MGDFESGVGVGIIVGIAVGIPLGWLIAQLFIRPSAATGQSAAGNKTYSNVEEWDIVKDERGRVKGVRVHRRAEEG
jgi:hypothetical protein